MAMVVDGQRAGNHYLVTTEEDFGSGKLTMMLPTLYAQILLPVLQHYVQASLNLNHLPTHQILELQSPKKT